LHHLDAVGRDEPDNRVQGSYQVGSFLREPVRDQIELRAVSPIRLQERCRSMGGNRSIERQDWHMTLPDRRCHSATV
jgi:hypothetical protein